MTARGEWAAYHDEQGDREPRDLLVRVVDAFEREGKTGAAVDVGCGNGIETAELIARGWDVTAIDAQEDAIRRVRGRVAAEHASRVRAIVSPMEDVTFPPADLVFASFSLPFCRPAAFPDLWGRLRSSLRPGGRFAGELFGDRDSWASDPEMSFFDVAAARSLFDGLKLESFVEEEEDGEGWDEPKHWHVFHVIARRPG
jgi:SAM-dependent methyltransferase